MALKPLGRRPWRDREAEEDRKPPLSEWLVDDDEGIVRVYTSIPSVEEMQTTVLVGSNSMTIQVVGEKNIQRRYSFPETVNPLKTQASIQDGVLEVVLHPCEEEIQAIHQIELD
ncbi:hypothetical protein EU546_00110 [Candidatus Thorarchaeota archaeon]|nr:MAG: hypothetical protein EU546_00110 [Candidatus Thorarchaeota archaeon]